MPKPIAAQRIGKQRIAGRPLATAFGLENLQEPVIFITEGAATFTAPKAGYWKFRAWGPGGNGANSGGGFYGGGSGAYLEITRFLSVGRQVPLVVGAPSSTDTTVSLPGFATATAGRGASDAAGTGGLGGTATGGDFMLNGSLGGGSATGGAAGLGTAGGAGTTTGGGAGAPGVTNYPGGAGGSGSQYCNGRHPGGGGGGAVQNPLGRGAGGMIVASFVRE